MACRLRTRRSALGTSQPAISRALKALERELGFDLFVREGRAFSRVTPQGAKVLEYANRALAEIDSLKAVAADLNQDNRGTLSIATTHTQARYVLPPVVHAFRERYPEVELHLHQGTSEQIGEMVATDRVQLAIATGSEGLFPGLVLLPVYRWYRQIIVLRHHPLAKLERVTIQDLAQYPLVTYVFSFTGSSSLHTVFAREGLTPESSPHRARFRRHQDLRAAGARGRHRRQRRDGPGAGQRFRHHRCLAPVSDPHHLDRLSTRHAAAQFWLRLHPAVRPASDAAAGRSGD